MSKKKKKNLIDKTTEKLGGGLNTVGGAVGDGIGAVGDAVGDSLNTVGEVVAGGLSMAGSGANKVGSSVGDTVKKGAEEADRLVQQLKEGLQKIGELGSTGTDNFAAYVMEIFEVLPFIEQAGYRANYVQVGISVPPSVEIQFERIQKLSEEEIEAMLEERRNQRFFRLILNALTYASNFQEKLKIRSMAFDEISLTISIPPVISIGFHHRDKEVETITISPEHSS